MEKVHRLRTAWALKVEDLLLAKHSSTTVLQLAGTVLCYFSRVRAIPWYSGGKNYDRKYRRSSNLWYLYMVKCQFKGISLTLHFSSFPLISLILTSSLSNQWVEVRIWSSVKSTAGRTASGTFSTAVHFLWRSTHTTELSCLIDLELPVPMWLHLRESTVVHWDLFVPLNASATGP